MSKSKNRKRIVWPKNGGRGGNSKPKTLTTWDDLDSGLQRYLQHRAPNPKGLSDKEVNEFWAEFTEQSSDSSTLNLDVSLATKRRIIGDAVKKRQHRGEVMSSRTEKRIVAKAKRATAAA